MACDEDQAFSFYSREESRIQERLPCMAADSGPDPMDCINYGITGHENTALINTRAEQIMARTFGRCKMQIRDVPDEGPVDFFRKRHQPIVASQPCLHMAYCDSMIERGRSSHHGRCCVALDKNPVRMTSREKLVELMEEP